MKKSFVLFLTFLLVFSLLPATFAVTPEASNAAQSLYELGLFNGTGTDANGNPNFDLDRSPTRNEAVTMLVRLLGKEKEAQSQTWATPFTDVEPWAKPYVGYAYAHGLAAGTALDKFSGSSPVTASQYITFVLRALAYRDGTDFQWNQAWELSDRIGFTNGEYNAASSFTRGDVAIISYRALQVSPKGSSYTLIELLQAPSSSERTASLDDIIAVLEAYSTGLDTHIHAIESSLAGVSSATTWGEIATVLQQEQAQLKVVANHFRTAASLCQDFSDLQTLKQYLFDLAASYNTLCNYNIVGTGESAWEFSDLEDIQSDQLEILQASIEAEVDLWIKNHS